MKYKVTVRQEVTYTFRRVEADSPEQAQEWAAQHDLQEADEQGDWEFYPEAELEDEQ